MQNVSQECPTDSPKIDKVNHDLQSTPQSTSNSSPTKSETETYSEHRRYMSDSSESEEDSVSEVESFMIDQEFEEDPQVQAAKFLLNSDEDRSVDPETQARLEALLQAAGISQLTAKDGKHLGDPEVLRRLTSSVSCALDEAAAALTRMRSDNPRPQPEKTSLVEACTDGDVGTVRKLLTEGRSVHETSEEGESLLSLACSAGYFELAQVLLAMHANVEDRGIKGECTPLMEAASAGHLDIVRLLVAHGADVNAQSTSGNTPLMYGCAGGHTDVVKFLLENGANVEDHNENGHTPLMEAASAGHVGLAKILLLHGAGINTHSNEFKESALTLACYKGHLDMVRFLLEAGADQEHKTDEMHTALMEASMDGHVEVARLLLDSGAQVNMPTDSFESPLTLAACGGHVDLAMLLIERGANIEEVNDEGYTPLMEAAREGHEEMVHLLLGQGANINAQTDETQETALTLACCGGFTEVADILLKGGADIELGASTPLMEAAQEGHLDLVKFLLENGSIVHAQTQTGDTALTYACENGHTDVADLLLQYGADLEHESEGGRTPLMKACRAGHMCTVQFLISKGANVRRQTTNNDHTPLSLACAGGHLSVVELLLSHNADPNHKLKDNSTMLIEASKGGHTNVVQLLLDYPHSMQPIILNQQQQQQTQQQAPQLQTGATTATNLAMLPGQVGSRESPLVPSSTASATPGGGTGALPPNLPPPQNISFFQPPAASTSSATTSAGAVLQEVPEAVRIVHQEDLSNPSLDVNNKQVQIPSKNALRKTILPKSRSSGAVFDGNLTSAEAQQVRTQPLNDFEDDVLSATAALELFRKQEPNSTLIDFIKNRKKYNIVTAPQSGGTGTDEGTSQKQQILEELHRVERELHGKQMQAHQNNVFQYGVPQQQEPCTTSASQTLPHMLNIDIAMQQQKPGMGNGMSGTMFPINNLQAQNTFYTGIPLAACLPSPTFKLTGDDPGPAGSSFTPAASNSPAANQPFSFTPLSATSIAANTMVTLSTATSNAGGAQTASVVGTTSTTPIKFQSVTSHTEVSQNTAISDRPKAKPVSKKEGKNVRKQLQQPPTPATSQQQTVIQSQQPQQIEQQQLQSIIYTQQQHMQVLKRIQQGQQQIQQAESPAAGAQFVAGDKTINLQETLNVEGLDLDALDEGDNIMTASILQHIHNTSIRFMGQPEKHNQITEKDFNSDDDVVQSELFTAESCDQALAQINLRDPQYHNTLDETMLASMAAAQQDLNAQADLSRVEYFTVPANGTQVPIHTLYPYDPYLTGQDSIYQAGFQAGFNLMQQLSCPNSSTSETLTTTTVVPTTVGPVAGTSTQLISQQQQTAAPGQCNHATTTATPNPSSHHCQPCTQHQQPPMLSAAAAAAFQPPASTSTMQVQAATQTLALVNDKKLIKISGDKAKKGRVMRQHQSQTTQPGAGFPPAGQNYQIDHNSAITQYSGANQAAQSQPAHQQQQQCPPTTVIAPCMDVDSETESNHDTALTLACAGGHEELVELLISRGADIEHRDKKGFTPLILAATAGHEKVVEILLNHNADIEAQSERTKDTPLSLACSGGRYEVVELLLNRNANKEHRNVSDYTPLSLAASGGYVNIIKLLLSHGAEINSRTGSKLGISPLMLAAMNGHTAAVKLLLDMGSDINAQIETNRNTALTLACFQGRHEVVSLLLDRKANVEHRAKTGLTPLMEAASGGYVEVGRVLLDKNADVNATPVPSSRDTALTIAADKGHVRFVELLLCRSAQVEVKNKKGNSPLWLAANGGHLPVVELLYNLSADIDSQDNRKVSCLMAAFRKGHVKVVKWMVHHVTQFPSDQEMIRFISTVSEKELLEKCQECVKVIRAAKETQAAKANKNASILLEELDMEKTREESKRLAAARRRERKKKKKLEKKEERRKLLEENKKNENYDEKDDDEKDDEDDDDKKEDDVSQPNPSFRSNGETPTNTTSSSSAGDKEEGDSGIDANSQGSCSSNDIKSKEKRKEKKKKKTGGNSKDSKNIDSRTISSKAGSSKLSDLEQSPEKSEKPVEKSSSKSMINSRKVFVIEANNSNHGNSVKSPAERDDFEATGNEVYVCSGKSKKNQSFENDAPVVVLQSKNTTSPKQSSKREEGWKEVVRKSSVQAVSSNESGVKKVSVPNNAISRVIGRGGSNINAIRGATGAHIEVEKQNKGQGDRVITIKGSLDATKQAHSLITTLIKDPDVDILLMLPKATKPPITATTLWDKTQIGTKKNVGKVLAVTQPITVPTNVHPKVTAPVVTPAVTSGLPATVTAKPRLATTVAPRATAPRLVAQAEKIAAAAQQQHQHQQQHQQQQHAVRLATSYANSNTSNASTRAAAKVLRTTPMQTFAAKLTETSTAQVQPISSSKHAIQTKPRSNNLGVPVGSNAGPLSPQAAGSINMQASPNKNARPAPTASAPPTMQHFQSPGKVPIFECNTVTQMSENVSNNIGRSSTPNLIQSSQTPLHEEMSQQNMQTPSEYSLFYSADQAMPWRRDQEPQKPVNFAKVTGGLNSQSAAQAIRFENTPPPQVDASKAPGYRGNTVCSPVSSKTSSNCTTPPNISANNSFQSYQESNKTNVMPPIGSNLHSRPNVSQSNQDHFDILSKTSIQNLAAANEHLLQTSFMPSSSIQNLNFSQPQQSVSTSRLNPKAPDFSSSIYNPMKPNQQQQQVFNGFPMNNQSNMYPPMSNKDQFNRNSVTFQQNRFFMQMQPPFSPQQTEMISNGISGMTLQTVLRDLENGEYVSPIMSPNLNPTHMIHNESHYYDQESRKPAPPQPIGTERARKAYNAQTTEAWNMGNDSKNTRWNLPAEQFLSRVQNNFSDEMPPMDFNTGLPLDRQLPFSNAPPFFNQQQQQQPPPMENLRSHEFNTVDSFKNHLWEATRGNLDIQEKGWNSKWQ